ncbi:Midasin, partial [Aduncisulcus paluster]
MITIIEGEENILFYDYFDSDCFSIHSSVPFSSLLVSVLPDESGRIVKKYGPLAEALIEGKPIWIRDASNASHTQMGLLKNMEEKGYFEGKRLKSKIFISYFSYNTFSSNFFNYDLIQFGNITQETIISKITNLFPIISPISSLISQLFLSLRKFFQSHEKVGSPSFRMIGVHDLLKFCHRISTYVSQHDIILSPVRADDVKVFCDGIEKISTEIRKNLYFFAIDCFCLFLEEDPSLESQSRRKLTRDQEIERSLHLFRDVVCKQIFPFFFPISTVTHKYSARRVRFDVADARIVSERYHLPMFHEKTSNIDGSESSVSKTMASIQKPPKLAFCDHTNQLIDRLLGCIVHNEPVLLVGETGVGKTTSLEYVARATQHPLSVINLSQQSDISDLFGGFKPVVLNEKEHNQSTDASEMDVMDESHELNDLSPEESVFLARSSRLIDKLSEALDKYNKSPEDGVFISHIRDLIVPSPDICDVLLRISRVVGAFVKLCDQSDQQEASQLGGKRRYGDVEMEKQEEKKQSTKKQKKSKLSKKQQKLKKRRKSQRIIGSEEKKCWRSLNDEVLSLQEMLPKVFLQYHTTSDETRQEEEKDDHIDTATAGVQSTLSSSSSSSAQVAVRRPVFKFIEGSLVSAVQRGNWILLDEINLAPPALLFRLNSLIESSSGSLLVTERGDNQDIVRHPSFRLFAAMNPATDVGKSSLPANVRECFSEIYVGMMTSVSDLMTLTESYLEGSSFCPQYLSHFVDIFRASLDLCSSHSLSDTSGKSVSFSLRNYSRTLRYIKDYAVNVYGEGCGGAGRFYAVDDAFSLHFLSQLSDESKPLIQNLINNLHISLGTATKKKKGSSSGVIKLNVPVRPVPSDVKTLDGCESDSFSLSNIKTALERSSMQSVSLGQDAIDDVASQHARYVHVGGFFHPRGPNVSLVDPTFILTDCAFGKLKELSRAVECGQYPILLEGPTSAGKTSIVKYLAKVTGNAFIRINNHEQTDLEEYVGRYVMTESARIEYFEGPLVRAMKTGAWVVLDELNLAPSEVLEALNRLLDDNRELFIPATGEYVKPHPSFKLFATQNPSGIYGGRKELSRAFRNRFVELHFSSISDFDIISILHDKCSLAHKYGEILVNVRRELVRERTWESMEGQGRMDLGLTSQSTSSDSTSLGVLAGGRGRGAPSSSNLKGNKQNGSHNSTTSSSSLTLRDMFRIAERNITNERDLCVASFFVLVERQRNEAWRARVKSIIEKWCFMMDRDDKKGNWKERLNSKGICPNLNTDELYDEHTKDVRNMLAVCITEEDASVPFDKLTYPLLMPYTSIVWTKAMKRAYSVVWWLLSECNEAPLLIGPTGGGKTTIIQLVSAVLMEKHKASFKQGSESKDEEEEEQNMKDETIKQINQSLINPLTILNAHQHTETSDIIGGVRPFRGRREIEDGILSLYQALHDFVLAISALNIAHSEKEQEGQEEEQEPSSHHSLESVISNYRDLSQTCSDFSGLISDHKEEDVQILSKWMNLIISQLQSSFFHMSSCTYHHCHPSFSQARANITADLSSRANITADLSCLSSFCSEYNLSPIISGISCLVDTLISVHSMLFQWYDGPLVLSMRNGNVFMIDEINNAEDAVLERINSVLEPDRTLTLAEKSNTGSSNQKSDTTEVLVAHPHFRFCATMNPSGDYGKKELSPALNNRMCAVWVTAIENAEDVRLIMSVKMRKYVDSVSVGTWNHDESITSSLLLDIITHAFSCFFVWLHSMTKAGQFGRMNVSVRDVLSGSELCGALLSNQRRIGSWNGEKEGEAKEGEEHRMSESRMRLLPTFIHALSLVFMDGLPQRTGLSFTHTSQLHSMCIEQGFTCLFSAIKHVCKDIYSLESDVIKELITRECSFDDKNIKLLAGNVTFGKDESGEDKIIVTRSSEEIPLKCECILCPPSQTNHEEPIPKLSVYFSVGPFCLETTHKQMPSLTTFSFNPPTTAMNTMRICRAMMLHKAILLEGSPGVGKSALVAAMAAVCGCRLVRINLSDQTDLADLMGCDLPSSSNSGDLDPKGTSDKSSHDLQEHKICFKWHDGPVLRAIKEGNTWVLLDEINLAPQQVLEGLNSLLDHRSTVFVPELNESFQCPPTFRVFATQNPLCEGGGRKGLPQSFINRFTQVYVDHLTHSDMIHVLECVCSELCPILRESMLDCVLGIADRIKTREIGIIGEPWEMNLRDVLRWYDIIIKDEYIKQMGVDSKEKMLKFWYKAFTIAKSMLPVRFRTTKDRMKVRRIVDSFASSCLKQMLGSDDIPGYEFWYYKYVSFFPSLHLSGNVLKNLNNSSNIVSSVDHDGADCGYVIKVGTVSYRNFSLYSPFFSSQIPPKLPLMSHFHLFHCAVLSLSSSLPILLTGRSNSGKSNIISFLSQVTKMPTHTLVLHGESDVCDIVGGFTQRDIVKIARGVCEDLRQIGEGLMRQVQWWSTILNSEMDNVISKKDSLSCDAFDHASRALTSCICHIPSTDAISCVLTRVNDILQQFSASLSFTLPFSPRKLLEQVSSYSTMHDQLTSLLLVVKQHGGQKGEELLSKFNSLMLSTPPIPDIEATASVLDELIAESTFIRPPKHKDNEKEEENKGEDQGDHCEEGEECISSSTTPSEGSIFQWEDGPLVTCAKRGMWCIIEGIDMCPPAVCDRLNGLLERGGIMRIHERGSVEGDEDSQHTYTVHPHPLFRVILISNAIDSSGDVSRALRNRCVEINVPVMGEEKEINESTFSSNYGQEEEEEEEEQDDDEESSDLSEVREEQDNEENEEEIDGDERKANRILSSLLPTPTFSPDSPHPSFMLLCSILSLPSPFLAQCVHLCMSCVHSCVDSWGKNMLSAVTYLSCLQNVRSVSVLDRWLSKTWNGIYSKHANHNGSANGNAIAEISFREFLTMGIDCLYDSIIPLLTSAELTRVCVRMCQRLVNSLSSLFPKQMSSMFKIVWNNNMTLRSKLIVDNSELTECVEDHGLTLLNYPQSIYNIIQPIVFNEVVNSALFARKLSHVQSLVPFVLSFLPLIVSEVPYCSEDIQSTLPSVHETLELLESQLHKDGLLQRFQTIPSIVIDVKFEDNSFVGNAILLLSQLFIKFSFSDTVVQPRASQDITTSISEFSILSPMFSTHFNTHPLASLCGTPIQNVIHILLSVAERISRFPSQYGSKNRHWMLFVILVARLISLIILPLPRVDKYEENDSIRSEQVEAQLKASLALISCTQLVFLQLILMIAHSDLLKHESIISLLAAMSSLFHSLSYATGEVEWICDCVEKCVSELESVHEGKEIESFSRLISLYNNLVHMSLSGEGVYESLWGSEKWFTSFTQSQHSVRQVFSSWNHLSSESTREQHACEGEEGQNAPKISISKRLPVTLSSCDHAFDIFSEDPSLSILFLSPSTRKNFEELYALSSIGISKNRKAKRGVEKGIDQMHGLIHSQIEKTSVSVLKTRLGRRLGEAVNVFGSEDQCSGSDTTFQIYSEDDYALWCIRERDHLQRVVASGRKSQIASLIPSSDMLHFLNALHLDRNDQDEIANRVHSSVIAALMSISLSSSLFSTVWHRVTLYSQSSDSVHRAHTLFPPLVHRAEAQRSPRAKMYEEDEEDNDEVRVAFFETFEEQNARMKGDYHADGSDNAKAEDESKTSSVLNEMVKQKTHFSLESLLDRGVNLTHLIGAPSFCRSLSPSSHTVISDLPAELSRVFLPPMQLFTAATSAYVCSVCGTGVGLCAVCDSESGRKSLQSMGDLVCLADTLSIREQICNSSNVFVKILSLNLRYLIPDLTDDDIIESFSKSTKLSHVISTLKHSVREQDKNQVFEMCDALLTCLDPLCACESDSAILSSSLQQWLIIFRLGLIVSFVGFVRFLLLAPKTHTDPFLVSQSASSELQAVCMDICSAEEECSDIETYVGRIAPHHHQLKQMEQDVREKVETQTSMDRQRPASMSLFPSISSECTRLKVSCGVERLRHFFELCTDLIGHFVSIDLDDPVSIGHYLSSKVRDIYSLCETLTLGISSFERNVTRDADMLYYNETIVPLQGAVSLWKTGICIVAGSVCAYVGDVVQHRQRESLMLTSSIPLTHSHPHKKLSDFTSPLGYVSYFARVCSVCAKSRSDKSILSIFSHVNDFTTAVRSLRKEEKRQEDEAASLFRHRGHFKTDDSDNAATDGDDIKAQAMLLFPTYTNSFNVTGSGSIVEEGYAAGTTGLAQIDERRQFEETQTAEQERLDSLGLLRVSAPSATVKAANKILKAVHDLVCGISTYTIAPQTITDSAIDFADLFADVSSLILPRSGLSENCRQVALECVASVQKHMECGVRVNEEEDEEEGLIEMEEDDQTLDNITINELDVGTLQSIEAVLPTNENTDASTKKSKKKRKRRGAWHGKKKRRKKVTEMLESIQHGLYDPYRHPAPLSELKLLVSPVNKIKGRIAALMIFFPRHAVLKLLLSLCNQLLFLPSSHTPLSKALTGLEMLYVQCVEYDKRGRGGSLYSIFISTRSSEETQQSSIESGSTSVYDGTGVKREIEDIIRRWRRAEGSSWEGLLESARRDYRKRGRGEWWDLYQTILNACIDKVSDITSLKSDDSIGNHCNPSKESDDPILSVSPTEFSLYINNLNEAVYECVRKYCMDGSVGGFAARVSVTNTIGKYMILSGISLRRQGERQPISEEKILLGSFLGVSGSVCCGVSNDMRFLMADVQLFLESEKQKIKKLILDQAKLHITWDSKNMNIIRKSASRQQQQLTSMIRDWCEILDTSVNVITMKRFEKNFTIECVHLKDIGILSPKPEEQSSMSQVQKYIEQDVSHTVLRACNSLTLTLNTIRRLIVRMKTGQENKHQRQRALKSVLDLLDTCGISRYQKDTPNVSFSEQSVDIFAEMEVIPSYLSNPGRIANSFTPSESIFSQSSARQYLLSIMSSSSIALSMLTQAESLVHKDIGMSIYRGIIMRCKYLNTNALRSLQRLREMERNLRVLNIFTDNLKQFVSDSSDYKCGDSTHSSSLMFYSNLKRIVMGNSSNLGVASSSVSELCAHIDRVKRIISIPSDLFVHISRLSELCDELLALSDDSQYHIYPAECCNIVSNIQTCLKQVRSCVSESAVCRSGLGGVITKTLREVDKALKPIIKEIEFPSNYDSTDKIHSSSSSSSSSPSSLSITPLLFFIKSLQTDICDLKRVCTVGVDRVLKLDSEDDQENKKRKKKLKKRFDCTSFGCVSFLCDVLDSRIESESSSNDEENLERPSILFSHSHFANTLSSICSGLSVSLPHIFLLPQSNPSMDHLFETRKDQIIECIKILSESMASIRQYVSVLISATSCLLQLSRSLSSLALPVVVKGLCAPEKKKEDEEDEEKKEEERIGESEAGGFGDDDKCGDDNVSKEAAQELDEDELLGFDREEEGAEEEEKEDVQKDNKDEDEIDMEQDFDGTMEQREEENDDQSDQEKDEEESVDRDMDSEDQQEDGERLDQHELEENDDNLYEDERSVDDGEDMGELVGNEEEDNDDLGGEDEEEKEEEKHEEDEPTSEAEEENEEKWEELKEEEEKEDD